MSQRSAHRRAPVGGWEHPQVDRAEVSRIAHRHHPIAAPVARGRARELLSWLSPPPAGRIVDLGCGAGEWLMELLTGREHLSGVGVDLSLPAEAATVAERRGLQERVRWVEADAATWSEGLFDAVLCVGASHAFGGLDQTLEGVRAHLRPGGQALVGDGIWEVRPSLAAQQALDAGPEEFPDLAGLVERVRQHGYEPSFGHVSTVEEWDDYEWSWTGSLIQWALSEAPTERAREEALSAAREHRDAWVHGYRRQLGFATLVLHDVAARPAEA